MCIFSTENGVYIKPNRVRSFHGNKMNYSQIRYAELVAHHKLEWGWRQNIIDAQTNQRTRTHGLNDLWMIKSKIAVFSTDFPNLIWLMKKSVAILNNRHREIHFIYMCMRKWKIKDKNGECAVSLGDCIYIIYVKLWI